MNKHLLAQIKDTWPDWEEWIGELWLQWEQVSARRMGVPKGEKRWSVTVHEIERIRREVRNEGRPASTLLSGDMDFFTVEPGDGVRRVARRGQRRGGRDPGAGSTIFNGRDR